MSEALASSEATQVVPEAPPNPFTSPMVMPGTEEIVTSVPVDHVGTLLYVKVLRHLVSTRPPMILVHDISEHADFYLAAAHRLLDAGYSVYLFDLRGHGRSGRQLGHAPNFAALVKDLLQVAAWVRFEEGGKAPVVVGHGVGALIAMDFSKAYPSFCKAAVLSAPCFELATPVSLVRRMMIKFLADVFPMARIPLLLKPKLAREKRGLNLSQLPDPFGLPRFPGLTAIFTQELLTAIKGAEARFVDYRGTALVLCPEQDSVCTFQHLRKLAAVHQEVNLEVVSLSDTTHRVFTGDEAACTQAVEKIISWLALKEGQVGPRPQAAGADQIAPT